MEAKGIVIIIPIPNVHVNDGWNVFPIVKASFAFDIIWFIISLLQLIGTFGCGLVPKKDRRPYVILLYATLAAVVYYLMHLIWLHMRDNMHVVIHDRLVVAIAIFYAITVVLQPAAVLLLIQNLCAKINVVKSEAPVLLSSRPWKRAFDWILVVVTFMLYIAAIGIKAAYVAAARSNTLSTGQAKTLSQSYEAIAHTLAGLVVLLSADILFSSIALFKVAKRLNWTNKNFNNVRQTIVPFSVIIAILWLVFDIYFVSFSTSATSYNAEAANFAKTFLEGICRIVITFSLLGTMDIPETPKKPEEPKEPKPLDPPVPMQTTTLSQPSYIPPVYNPPVYNPPVYNSPIRVYNARQQTAPQSVATPTRVPVLARPGYHSDEPFSVRAEGW